MTEKPRPSPLLSIRGEEVQYRQQLPITQHNRIGARGDTNNQPCLGQDGQPSQFGKVALKQLAPFGKPATPVVECDNCFYIEL